MRDQLKRLEELQKFDAEIQELSNVLKAIPAKLDATRTDLARVEAILVNERNQLSEARRYYDEQVSQLESEEGHVSSAKGKLGQVKNTREMSAAQREIDNTREALANREAEIAKLVEVMKNKEKLLEERDADVKALSESIAKDDEVARSKMADIELKISAIRVDREKIAKDVRPDVLKRYSSIRMRKGLALAPVTSGACRGCNMNIPPQLFITLQKASSVETCPYCHRIIYWDEVMKDKVEGAELAVEPEKEVKPKAKAKAKPKLKKDPTSSGNAA